MFSRNSLIIRNKTVLKPTQVDKFSKLRYRKNYVEGTRQNDSVSLWRKSDFNKIYSNNMTLYWN